MIDAETMVTLLSEAACCDSVAQPFRFLDLPIELGKSIIEHLGIGDVISVRSSCRALNSLSTDAFGSYFNSVLAILFPQSLNMLCKVADSPKVSKYVCEVTISGEQYIEGIVDMEASRTDIGTKLQEALKKFQNLQVVAVTNATTPFFGTDEIGEFEDAIRCWDHDFQGKGGSDRLRDRGLISDRVFGVVWEALEKAELHQNIKVELLVYIKEEDSWPFNLDVSDAINSVGLFGEGADSPWGSYPLCSVPNLRHLDACGSISRLAAGAVPWSKLLTIDLNDSILPLDSDSLINGLITHNNSLSKLYLGTVGLSRGTWMTPLQLILEIPTLDTVSLFGLFQKDAQIPPANSGDFYFDLNTEEDDLKPFRETHFALAVQALAYDFRTIKSNFLLHFLTWSICGWREPL